jgi:hypothetical protein
MKDWYVPLAICIVTLVAIGIGTTQSYFMIQENPFEAKDLFKQDMNKPVLWIFYDTSVLNSRNYSDFGSRSSRALNLPFLNLCYESIATHNSSLYRIEAIDGLPGLAKLLGGWDMLPQKLQNPLVTLEPSDFAWIRSSVLAKSGGLWVAPSTICLRPFGKLPEKPVFFGTDPDESFSGTSGTAVPNFQVAWSPSANDPLWVAWEAKSRHRLNTSGGGDTARSADKWEFMALKEMFGDLEIRPLAEVGRKGAAGRRIQLEDLLAAGQEGVPLFEIGANAVYVTVPLAELRDRRTFGWFLRMSESQIAESDLVIRDLFQLSGVI